MTNEFKTRIQKKTKHVTSYKMIFTKTESSGNVFFFLCVLFFCVRFWYEIFGVIEKEIVYYRLLGAEKSVSS